MFFDAASEQLLRKKTKIFDSVRLKSTDDAACAPFGQSGSLSAMDFPTEPRTLSPEQIEELNNQFSTMRHNINNNLSMIIAATELIRIKPDAAERMLDQIVTQPDRVMLALKEFTEQFDKTLGIERD